MLILLGAPRLQQLTGRLLRP
ncbi:hypothetical protein [Zobellella taiwanensis]